jgi:hypothetical protein
MSYFYKLFPVKVYEKEVPKDFKVPSLYFPAPITFDENDTNMTFIKVYSLSVKLFHEDSTIANEKAELIADAIRSNRNIIPLVDPEGEPTGDYIRMTRIETRIGDSGVATIVLQWESSYHYSRQEWPVANSIELNSEVK